MRGADAFATTCLQFNLTQRVAAWHDTTAVSTEVLEDRASSPPPGRLRTLVEFSRPHTIIGTTLAVCILFVLSAHAAGQYDLRTPLLVLVASLAVNVYIVGLNQITDVDIDR